VWPELIEYISRHAVPECDSSSARGESYTTVAGGVIRIRNSSRCKGAHYSRKVELGSAPIGVRQQDPRNGICSSLAETSLETEVSRILFQQARIDECAPKAGRRLIGESRAMALTETFCFDRRLESYGWPGLPCRHNGSLRLRLRYLGRGGRRFLVLQTSTLAHLNAEDKRNRHHTRPQELISHFDLRRTEMCFHPPFVLSHGFEDDFNVPLPPKALKLLSPLYQQNAALAHQIVKPQCFQLTQRVHTIQVDVIEIHCGTPIFMNQRERGTIDLVLRGDLKTRSNSFHQGRLARPQVAAQ